MTGSHLPPDTAREISALKVRVSDLERVLDRIRRTLPDGADRHVPGPFAALEGTGYGGVEADAEGAWTIYWPTNTVVASVVDPTGHLRIDSNTYGPWSLRVDIAGIYEFGMSVTFEDDATKKGDRAAGIALVDAGGIVDRRSIDQMAAAEDNSVISGSRIVVAEIGSHWRPLFGDNVTATLAGSLTSFWGRLVSYGEPETGYVGSA